MQTLNKSWLVQRLDRPRHIMLGNKPLDNPFSFGGGLKNGGLSSEAMDLIRDIWSFDYMGAAEFEFGAVPQTLQKLANSSLVAFSFQIPLKSVEKDWKDKSKTEPEGNGTVYVLCPTGWEKEVKARIREFARKDYSMKAPTFLPQVLRPGTKTGWTPETAGWLELDNGFMFFVDQEMWTKTCDLFGVKRD